jgi:alpha-galactosidase
VDGWPKSPGDKYLVVSVICRLLLKPLRVLLRIRDTTAMAPFTSTLLLLPWAVYASAQTFSGKTPPMGYNSYNQLSCSPTDATITAAINGMADRGFVAAGYNLFGIDCGWASRDGKRNATNGALAVDLKAFPRGLKPLSDLARSRGLQWSMYSDAGVRMCDPQVPSPVLGSLGHEAADADFFKSLGTVYVKCRSRPPTVDHRY